jgi:hypothetical protein
MGQDHGHDGDHAHARHDARQPSRDEARAGPSRRDVGASAAASPLSGLAWAAAPELSGDMGKAACAWLASLEPRQQARALLPWADPMRNSWHYVRAAGPASHCAT